MSSPHQQINTLPHNGFRLITLGRLALLGPDQTEDASLGNRRRKLALLAVLALAAHPLERDYLLDLFWGDQDEDRARHSLSDALSHLRRVLGPGSITTRRTDVSLSDGARLSVDAHDLTAAAATNDWARVTELYTGGFLDVIHVDNSPGFERWASVERDRLQGLFVRACTHQCLSLARTRNWDECAALAARWLDVEPLSADAALYLMNSLKAPNTRAADARALEAYERIVERLARDYDATPERSVSDLASDVAQRVAARGDQRQPIQPRHEPSSNHHEHVPAHASQPPWGRWRPVAMWAALAGLGVIVASSLAFAAMHRDDASRASNKPAIAAFAIQNRTGDTSSAWLSDGLPQMIIADLSRSAAVDVVDPSRVAQVLQRAGVADDDSVPLEAARDVAHRAGATWFVNGTLSRGNGTYMLTFALRDVASGKLLRPGVVSDTSVMSLADHAAAELLTAADAESPGPRLADVETSSLDAYEHFVRASQAEDEGRVRDEARELDAAIALDSGFVAALRLRMSMLAGRETARDSAERLSVAFQRAAPRASARDRLEQSFYVAFRNGERARSEALARLLVERYPRDPRSYKTLAGVYDTHGRWASAESVLVRELALDSLAAEAGQGPCAPCVAFNGLIDEHEKLGELSAAQRVANRWITLQPDLPAAWGALAGVLSFEQHFDAALEAQERAAYLAGSNPAFRIGVGRALLVARRWHDADSLITEWLRSPSPDLRAGAYDLRMLLQRERGQLRAANRTADTFPSALDDDEVMRLMEGAGLGALGQYAAATEIYETAAHAAAPTDAGPAPLNARTGDIARLFSWLHALEADAIAPSGDTIRLHVLADSIEMMSARSYYGRDWGLAHHVRGLIAMRGHRYAEADREFRAARWGPAGWTRTEAELAKAQLALGRPRDAIATLREAYEGPLDAMGRYEPRSNLDFLMAKAFQQAGMADSAAVYAGYVRRAWQNADPEVKGRLAELH